MDDFTITLAEERAERLRELAREARMSPEQLLQTGVDEWLSRPGEDFPTSAAYVLQKNRELYRRLS